MTFKTAEFIISSTDYKKCPPGDKPEYAFIGRSNVGKSSLINMLTNHKNLAKTSSTPGKTQLINHFLVDNQWYLVDLPGYGWAKVSKSKKQQWKKMITAYLLNRDNLYLLFILLDSRRLPQQVDMDFIHWSGENGIPLAIIFTKSDKISKNTMFAHRKAIESRLKEDWEELPKIFTSSATNKTGKIEISDYIRTTAQQ
ncbi:MAG: YihA family ribosome biogenesis GTP-binding protein [Bacteroidetes bacterium]|nr:MAG: YihA family ribosome biogenesis GTP-binding protein [Bacteroidota bacterium]